MNSTKELSEYRVVQAVRLNRNHREVPAGWDLMKNDMWCQRFYYKSDATKAKNELELNKDMV